MIYICFNDDIKAMNFYEENNIYKMMLILRDQVCPILELKGFEVRITKWSKKVDSIFFKYVTKGIKIKIYEKS